MGGFGSGKWIDLVNRKTTVDLCNEISAKSLKEKGFFDASISGIIEWKNTSGVVVNRVDIESSISVDIDKTSFLMVRREVLSTESVKRHIEQRVELIQWPCNYGGFRYFFACPAVKNGVYCGDRTTKLYLPRGGQIFACRHCYDLTHKSAQENHKYDKVFGHIKNSDMGSLSLNQALRLGGALR